MELILICLILLSIKVLFFTPSPTQGNFTRQNGKITFDQTKVSPRILGDKK